jgi:hypothetical protein
MKVQKLAFLWLPGFPPWLKSSHYHFVYSCCRFQAWLQLSKLAPVRFSSIIQILSRRIWCIYTSSLAGWYGDCVC